MTEYSQRLGTIAPEQFQRALDRWGLGRFTGAEPVRWGNFGQVAFVSSTRGEWVLRGAPHWPSQFLEERWAVDLLHERTRLPVPWPYRVDTRGDIFGWGYVLMPRLRGLQLEDPEVRSRLSPGDEEGIARALGETLAEMQRATWEFSGEYDAGSDEVRPFAEGYAGWVLGRVRRTLALAREHTPELTTRQDAAWVEGVLGRAREALDEPFVPRFVMADYKYQNALVERAGEGWRVSGVFDIGGWLGDGEAALSRQAAMYLEQEPRLARAFVRAYLGRLPARPGFRERWGAYMLDERLAIWEWAQRERMAWWDPRLTLREWAEPFVEWGAVATSGDSRAT